MKAPRRREGWEGGFLAAYNRHAVLAFAYGRHDCALAVADIVKAMTGTDLARTFRRYKTIRGAANRLRRFGGIAGLADHIAAAYGLEEIRPAFAQRGDVVLFDGGNGETLGVVNLDGRSVIGAARAGGWETRPANAVRRAWRI